MKLYRLQNYSKEKKIFFAESMGKTLSVGNYKQFHFLKRKFDEQYYFEVKIKKKIKENYNK